MASVLAPRHGTAGRLFRQLCVHFWGSMGAQFCGHWRPILARTRVPLWGARFARPARTGVTVPMGLCHRPQTRRRHDIGTGPTTGRAGATTIACAPARLGKRFAAEYARLATDFDQSGCEARANTAVSLAPPPQICGHLAASVLGPLRKGRGHTPRRHRRCTSGPALRQHSSVCHMGLRRPSDRSYAPQRRRHRDLCIAPRACFAARVALLCLPGGARPFPSHPTGGPSGVYRVRPCGVTRQVPPRLLTCFLGRFGLKGLDQERRRQPEQPPSRSPPGCSPPPSVREAVF